MGLTELENSGIFFSSAECVIKEKSLHGELIVVI